jgi:hypothetical protein
MPVRRAMPNLSMPWVSPPTVEARWYSLGRQPDRKAQFSSLSLAMRSNGSLAHFTR